MLTSRPWRGAQDDVFVVCCFFLQRQAEGEGARTATDDAVSPLGHHHQQQQQPATMVTNDDDDDDGDDDSPPDYEMTTAGTSGSTLASDVLCVCTAGENTSLFMWPFVGTVPAPPAYQRYTMAVDVTGLCAQLS